MTRNGMVSRALAGALACAAATAACGREPLWPDGRAAAGGPARALNPACSGTGTTHAAGTVAATEHWTPAGNPHHVTGTVRVEGAQLRIHAGALVCFAAAGGIEADDGGQLAVAGEDTARVVLTAADLAAPWGGIHLSGTPIADSYVSYATIEHNGYSVVAEDDHLLVMGHVHVRRSHEAASLLSPGSRIVDSVVDTTTSAGAAVLLGDSARFIRTTVRGAAYVGVEVAGVGVTLAGGRVEGSGGVGLFVWQDASVASADPLRVTGGGSYPAALPVSVLERVYPTLADQDSLLGNARDTVVVTGGTMDGILYAGPDLPWRVDGFVTVASGGQLRAEPGARIAAGAYGAILSSGGRLLARGSAAQPVVFTAADPAQGWLGIRLLGTPASASFLTNAVVEHVKTTWTAVLAGSDHPIVIDSTVVRRSGRAVDLSATGSRLSRSRVDTTYDAAAAVELRANAKIESTLIRGSAGHGLSVASASVQVVSCEVRGSADEGIVLLHAVAVHDCNLADNGGVGIDNRSGTLASATGNWWGDAAGPTGPNGDGSAGLLTVSPWRTSAYSLPYVP